METRACTVCGFPYKRALFLTCSAEGPSPSDAMFRWGSPGHGPGATGSDPTACPVLPPTDAALKTPSPSELVFLETSPCAWAGVGEPSHQCTDAPPLTQKPFYNHHAAPPPRARGPGTPGSQSPRSEDGRAQGTRQWLKYGNKAERPIPGHITVRTSALRTDRLRSVCVRAAPSRDRDRRRDMERPGWPGPPAPRGREHQAEAAPHRNRHFNTQGTPPPFIKYLF